MTGEIIVALITAIVTVMGVILSNNKTAAVTQNEIKHLSEEVAYHNNFARRMPVLEEQVTQLTRRIENLERKGD